ncbi:histidine phosphatase family protein [Azorhizobium doebereinerae]|uniref:histidine phosphatase family protein n=1 Tax=Azorhizobium doebereinerae TaxID=281091 RepID=UPI0004138A22|nr:histidine phosphatase family protein [Azorhizobium doebereinerae]
MTPFLYVSHPQVRIDPAVPVPDWGLSEQGRARAEAFAREPALMAYGRVVSSTEAKARETAAILAAALSLVEEVRPGLHENDRSATGYLPEAEFQQVANAFFADPEHSARGWERAVDAQDRIVRGVRLALAEAPGTPTLFVGHGGVGTLLLCHLAGQTISRAHDQPPVGGGCWFRQTATDAPDRWRSLEEAPLP